jgi:hypothetical protein
MIKNEASDLLFYTIITIVVVSSIGSYYLLHVLLGGI